MLTEPSFNQKFIKSKIEDSYGLKVINLSFIKGGECSWGYKVEIESGTNYFFKIHTGLEESAVRFDLTYKLSNECNIKNITHPIKNQAGELVIYIDQYPAALFNFIHGAVVAERTLDDKQRFALGELLGRVHKAKEIIGEFQLKEDFKYSKAEQLLNNIEKAGSLKNHQSKYKSKVAQLLIDYKDQISEKLQRLEGLGDQLREQNLDFVICHGEPHKWNVMIDDKEEIFLIDWDDCSFAPKEKYLGMIKGDEVAFDGYKHIVGEYTLNQDVLKFYDLKWNISEIEDWSSRIFYGEENDVQNQHYLEAFLSELETLTKKI